MQALTTYLRNVRQEFKHLRWPTPREAIAHTLMIILISAIVAVMVGLLDYAFTSIVSGIVG